MDKEKLREIIYILVAIILAIVAFKLFIWLLPIILIALLAYIIYISMKKSRHINNDEGRKKNKKTIIIDSEDNEK